MTIETHRFCTTRRTTPYDLCRSRLPSRPAAIQQKWSRFFLTLCNYAFSETYLCPTVTQPALPLWHSSDDAFGPGPSSYNESFGSYAGLAQAYSQDPHEAFLTDQVFQSKATCVEHGQHPINQNWISVIGGPLQDDVFFGSDTREADTPNGLLGKVSGSLGPTVVNHDDQAVLSPGTLASVPVVPVPTMYLGALQQIPPGLDAVVMQRDDGVFFCSQVGCDAAYARIGDCRRHLKKHNGAFFYCEQQGCGMEFYRQDKPTRPHAAGPRHRHLSPGQQAPSEARRRWPVSEPFAHVSGLG